jgi:hypothetical protein
MKKKKKKITIRRETIRRLGALELRAVPGGVQDTGDVNCPRRDTGDVNCPR